MQDDPAADQSAVDPTAPEPTVTLGHIPISLQFATQSQSVSLAELQAMTPGTLVPFEITSPEVGMQVSVLANGAAIGIGHLVHLDGAYAVRIAKMSNEG